MNHRVLSCLLTLALLHAYGAPLAGAAPSLEHRKSKELVAFVTDAAELVAEQGVQQACHAFSEPGSRWRYGEEDYVFVLDIGGNIRCHPARPELESEPPLLDLHDPRGKPIIEGLLRQVAGGGEEGWFHYLWPKPGGATTFYWKSSYVRRVSAPDGADYLVGSGVYDLPMERRFIVEVVEEAAELIGRRGEAAFATLRDPASGFRFYDAYIFVMDSSGVQRVNAAFPDNEGKNLLELEDEEGTVIGREMLEVVHDRGAGWVDYLWPKPGDTATSEKSAYVEGVEVEGQLLVVGAGYYPE